MMYLNGQPVSNIEFTGIVNVDQTYIPESENPQSGKAVAEALANISISGGIDPAALQRKLELWQPNTEYKVGDVVVEQLLMHLQMVTNILVCRQNHISGDDMFDTVTAGDYWDCYPIYALNSTCASADDNGNPIIETYATKEELQNGYATVDHTHNSLVSKDTYYETIGDIETVLDNIIALQNSLIGGESV